MVLSQLSEYLEDAWLRHILHLLNRPSWWVATRGWMAVCGQYAGLGRSECPLHHRHHHRWARHGHRAISSVCLSCPLSTPPSFVATGPSLPLNVVSFSALTSWFLPLIRLLPLWLTTVLPELSAHSAAAVPARHSVAVMSPWRRTTSPGKSGTCGHQYHHLGSSHLPSNANELDNSPPQLEQPLS